LVWILVLVTLTSDPQYQLKGVFQTQEACLVMVEDYRKKAGGEFAVNTTAFCIQTNKQ